jgi:putative acyl-CoA dehydrogenase
LKGEEPSPSALSQSKRERHVWVQILQLADRDDVGGRARQITDMMAFALQGALLVRYSPPAVADAFYASRLAGDWGRAFGTLPSGLAYDDIIKRARVEPR